MINVAQAWAEAYADVARDVSVEVAGGGSGVGIAALIDGTVQMANSSRPLKADEIAHAQRVHGRDPMQIVAGYDALAVYVHRDNPVVGVDARADCGRSTPRTAKPSVGPISGSPTVPARATRSFA